MVEQHFVPALWARGSLLFAIYIFRRQLSTFRAEQSPCGLIADHRLRLQDRQLVCNNIEHQLPNLTIRQLREAFPQHARRPEHPDEPLKRVLGLRQHALDFNQSADRDVFFWVLPQGRLLRLNIQTTGRKHPDATPLVSATYNWSFPPFALYIEVGVKDMSLKKEYVRDGKHRVIGSVTNGFSDESSVVRDEQNQIAGRTSERFRTTRNAHGNLVSIDTSDPGLLIRQKK
jgi:hypothetical protein